MDLERETQRIGALLDEFAKRSPGLMLTVASEDDKDAGAVKETWAGPVDSDGWVEWRMLPSRLTLADLLALEGELGVAVPTMLAAYLLARSHLFDQAHSRKHGQLVGLSAVPVQAPLRPFRRALKASPNVVRAGYVPFGSWGDGWGPLCIDVGAFGARVDDGPIVWFDHETAPLVEAAARDVMVGHAQPVSESFAAFVEDVFGGD